MGRGQPSSVPPRSAEGGSVRSEGAARSEGRPPTEGVRAEGPVRPEGVPEDAILRVLRVPPESEGMRLDRFLPSQLRSTSRTRARAIIENSAYSWDGRRLRPSDRVRGEDRIALWRPAFEELPAPEQLTILYEDPYLLAIDKPPLMTVHPTARHHHHTVIKRLEALRPGEFFSLIHRLDRETSGVLLIARSPEADSAFKRHLEERSLATLRALGAEDGSPEAARSDKTYLALTWGVPPEGFVDLPLEPDPSPLRVKMRVAQGGGGLPSRTKIQVLERRGPYALVRCDLYTGRQHQIRVHLAHLGAPVVGDKLYGPDEQLLARAADGQLTEDDLRRLELPRHALHAHEYRLEHCFTKAPLTITSPLAADLQEFWDSRPR